MRNGYFGIARCIAITVAVIILFNVIGGVFLVALYGMNVEGGSPAVIIAVNGLAQLSVMLTAPILISKNMRQNLSAVFRLEGLHETPTKVLVFGVPMMLLAQVVGSGMGTLWTSLLQLIPSLYHTLTKLQDTLDKMMGSLTTAHSPAELIILLIGISLIPAIAEEVFFRGFVQTNIERSGKNKPRPIVAIIVTSILFAAMHASPMNFPGLFTIGATLGWLAYRTNDIRVSMLAHALNNGLIVLSIYFFSGSEETVDALAGTPEMTITQALMLLGVSLPLFLMGLYLFQKWTEPLSARHNAEYELSAINEHDESHEPVNE
jgi:membrane protease YdiL (CAAX protease family)